MTLHLDGKAMLEGRPWLKLWPPPCALHACCLPRCTGGEACSGSEYSSMGPLAGAEVRAD